MLFAMQEIMRFFLIIHFSIMNHQSNFTQVLFSAVIMQVYG